MFMVSKTVRLYKTMTYVYDAWTLQVVARLMM